MIIFPKKSLSNLRKKNRHTKRGVSIVGAGVLEMMMNNIFIWLFICNHIQKKEPNFCAGGNDDTLCGMGASRPGGEGVAVHNWGGEITLNSRLFKKASAHPSA